MYCTQVRDLDELKHGIIAIVAAIPVDMLQRIRKILTKNKIFLQLEQFVVHEQFMRKQFSFFVQKQFM